MNLKIIRRNEVAKMLGIAESTLSDWQNPKSPYYRSNFPKRIPLGKRAVGYLEHEIIKFMEEMIQRKLEGETV